ncbi:lipoprotein [Oceanobacillus sp. FSL H7-0719]|uniref:LptM family lipoprotein n=1 Tax=Oceanobacillus sp. FSL H7-0719 TaxID=2954507 RepID=UPI0032539DCD
MKRTFLFLIILISSLTLVGCGNKAAEEYKTNIQEVADDILENSSKAESLLNQYASIWSYSIKSKGAIPIEDMVAQTGLDEGTVMEHFVISYGDFITDDFSTNIYSMVSYYTETGELEEIEEKSKKIKSKINELNNPPSDYEKVYDEILDMYTYSEEYIGLALNPSGTLQDFNDSRNQLSNDILSKYKRVEAILPNEDK